MTNADRADDLLARTPERTRITEGQDNELAWLLWDAHDGDDRCGCLRSAVVALLDDDQMLALEWVRNCVAEHSAGRDIRKALAL